MCKTLGGGDFTGEYIETVNIENAESIESTIDAEFINAFSLKNIYAPKLKQVPAFDFDDVGLQQIKNGKNLSLNIFTHLQQQNSITNAQTLKLAISLTSFLHQILKI